MTDRVELEDVSLRLEDRGGGPSTLGDAAVFLHGLGGSVHSWWAQLAACEERGHRAIAYDQRGAGRSSRPPGPYSVELWAEDAERVLDALGLERVALVGNSVGCMVAERAAVRLGDRVTALALLGGALRWRPESRPVFEERVRLARAGRMDEIAAAVARTGLTEACRDGNPALDGLFRELIASSDPVGYAEWAQATGVAEMTETERVSCPVLALCGENDPVAGPDFAEAIASAFPRGRSAVVPGAAHWCQIEAPQATNEVLLGFLDEVIT